MQNAVILAMVIGLAVCGCKRESGPAGRGGGGTAAGAGGTAAEQEARFWDDVLSIQREVADVLEGIHDDPDYKAAAPKLDALLDRLKGLNADRATHLPMTHMQSVEIRNRISQERRKELRRMDEAWTRVKGRVEPYGEILPSMVRLDLEFGNATMGNPPAPPEPKGISLSTGSIDDMETAMVEKYGADHVARIEFEGLPQNVDGRAVADHIRAYPGVKHSRFSERLHTSPVAVAAPVDDLQKYSEALDLGEVLEVNAAKHLIRVKLDTERFSKE